MHIITIIIIIASIISWLPKDWFVYKRLITFKSVYEQVQIELDELDGHNGKRMIGYVTGLSGRRSFYAT